MTDRPDWNQDDYEDEENDSGENLNASRLFPDPFRNGKLASGLAQDLGAEESYSESDENSIQDILDDAYDTLDRFQRWLEDILSVDSRRAQQDVFNAESLLDYLANYERKSVTAINEFDLRWFVFSHYVRKALADAETEEILLTSLQRLFEYLRVREDYAVPDWIYAVQDDSNFFLARRKAYHELPADDERRWEEGFRVWSEELEQDLDARCLWLPREIGDGLCWSERMGWREATLYGEANQLWQEERTELLQNGLDFESARSHLLSSYLLWTETPQDKLEYQTPLEVITEERQQRRDEEDEDETDRDDDEGRKEYGD